MRFVSKIIIQPFQPSTTKKTILFPLYYPNFSKTPFFHPAFPQAFSSLFLKMFQKQNHFEMFHILTLFVKYKEHKNIGSKSTQT